MIKRDSDFYSDETWREPYWNTKSDNLVYVFFNWIYLLILSDVSKATMSHQYFDGLYHSLMVKKMGMVAYCLTNRHSQQNHLEVS